jgi:cytochrome d ubiquinol oxidase subunit I
VLPTFLAASGLQLHQIIISLTGFVLIYTSLAIVDVYLLRKVILKGPDEVPGGERRPDHEGTPLAAASSTVA